MSKPPAKPQNPQTTSSIKGLWAKKLGAAAREENDDKRQLMPDAQHQPHQKKSRVSHAHKITNHTSHVG